MKNAITIYILFLITLSNAQVNDLPIAFSKKGYVQAIDYDQKMIQVNFFKVDKNLGEEEVLRSQVFSIANSEMVDEKKDKININKLRSSDEIQVDGQWFEVKDEYIIKKITLISKEAEDKLEGRIDLIKGDFAYIDGNKVKLGDGKKITGDKDTGYKGQTYSSVNQIKEGDYATVKGKYNNEGYYSASSFVIKPDLKTSVDKAVIEADKEMYDYLFPDWTDPVKRKAFFGKKIAGMGKIVNNAEVQDYVDRVGQKLIPPHIIKNRKINFVFVVVENPDLLAYVRPNGVAFICSGLLYTLENEAQLAAVLGHEISHAIYEHQAGEERRKDVKEQQTKTFGGLFSKGTAIANKVIDIKAGIDDSKKTNVETAEEKDAKLDAELERKKQREKNQELLKSGIETTTSLYHDKKISDYSVEDEYQADRVGLCLAILAGYDPREAPLVWKNLYERYGEISDDKDKAAITDKQVAAVRKEDIENKNKTYTTGGLVAQAATGLMTIKQIDYKAKSVKTHPDEIKRYQALNKLVALYWNNSKLIEETVNNEENYRNMLTKLAQSRSKEESKEKKVAPATPKKKK